MSALPASQLNSNVWKVGGFHRVLHCFSIIKDWESMCRKRYNAILLPPTGVLNMTRLISCGCDRSFITLIHIRRGGLKISFGSSKFCCGLKLYMYVMRIWTQGKFVTKIWYLYKALLSVPSQISIVLGISTEVMVIMLIITIIKPSLPVLDYKHSG